jgi:hypothetical protein
MARLARPLPGDPLRQRGDLGRERRVGQHRQAQPMAQRVARHRGLAGARARPGAAGGIGAVGGETPLFIGACSRRQTGIDPASRAGQAFPERRAVRPLGHAGSLRAAVDAPFRTEGKLPVHCEHSNICHASGPGTARPPARLSSFIRLFNSLARAFQLAHASVLRNRNDVVSISFVYWKSNGRTARANVRSANRVCSARTCATQRRRPRRATGCAAVAGRAGVRGNRMTGSPPCVATARAVAPELCVPLRTGSRRPCRPACLAP